MSPQAIKRLKEEQRVKGANDAKAAQEAEAKKRGFVSYQAMLDHLDRLAATPPGKPPKRGGNGAPGDPPGDPAAPPAGDPPNPPNPRNGGGRYDRQIRTLETQLQGEKTGRLELTHKAKRLQAELDALQARSALEKTAIRGGVKDVDYALVLLQRHLEGARLTDDQLEEFDYTAFFEGLRKSHPYVFGEQVRPANSGTGGNNEPPPPPPGGGGGQPDKTNFNEKDGKGKFKVDEATYREALRKRGLDVNSFS